VGTGRPRGSVRSEKLQPLAVAQRCFVVLTGSDPYVVVADAFVKDAEEHDYSWLLHGNADSNFDLARIGHTHFRDAALDIVPCSLTRARLRTRPSGFRPTTSATIRCFAPPSGANAGLDHRSCAA